MKKVALAFLLIVVVIMFTNVHVFSLRKSHSTLPSNDAVPVLDAQTQALLNQFDAYTRESIEREQLPGVAVVVVKDGQVIFTQCYGVKSVDTQELINPHTVFRLASLSKGFAAVLASIIVKDGQIDWNDPVRKYVPDLRLYKNQYSDLLTIRHVLSHTTGLPRQAFSNLIEAGHSYLSARQRLAEVKPTHKPGTWYNYQNVAYSLIGEVVECATGRRFEQLLYSRIFLPLQMTNASAGYANFMLDTTNIARPHRLEKERYRPIPVSPNYYEVMPAAGVNASISDMGQWLLLLLGHYPKVITKDELKTLYQKQIDVPMTENNHRAFPEATESWYGLGWRGVISHGRHVVFHGGYVNGFRSEIAFIPSEDIGIAILSNAPSWYINSAVPIFFSMYWGLPYEEN